MTQPDDQPGVTPIPGTDYVAVDGLPHPDPPILMTLVYSMDGQSKVRHLIPVEEAAQILRDTADQLVADAAAQAEGQEA